MYKRMIKQPVSDLEQVYIGKEQPPNKFLIWDRSIYLYKSANKTSISQLSKGQNSHQEFLIWDSSIKGQNRHENF